MSASNRPVDLNNIKDRIAEALVESIFRRAEYKMTRFVILKPLANKGR
jgi:hypothetical protein